MYMLTFFALNRQKSVVFIFKTVTKGKQLWNAEILGPRWDNHVLTQLIMKVLRCWHGVVVPDSVTLVVSTPD